MWLRGTQLNQIALVEEVDLEKAPHLLERNPLAGLEARECQDQVCAQGDPDLGHDGVLGGPQEGLALQVLFDRLKEQLDGMISNDPFCCTRWGARQLAWWRRPNWRRRDAPGRGLRLRTDLTRRRRDRCTPPGRYAAG